jgi:nucleoside recognition membrane protein YjiH
MEKIKTKNELITDFIKPFLKHLAEFFAIAFAHFWFFMGFGLCLADQTFKESPLMGVIVVIWAIGCIVIAAGIRTYMKYEEKKEKRYGTTN